MLVKQQCYIHLWSFFNIIYSFLGSIFEPCCIQNCVITNRVLKRLKCSSFPLTKSVMECTVLFVSSVLYGKCHCFSLLCLLASYLYTTQKMSQSVLVCEINTPLGGFNLKDWKEIMQNSLRTVYKHFKLLKFERELTSYEVYNYTS